MIYGTILDDSDRETVIMEFGVGTIASIGGSVPDGIEVRFWNQVPALPIGPLRPEQIPDVAPDVTMRFNSPTALLELAGSLIKVAQCALAEEPTKPATLTAAERQAVSVAKVGASNETDNLVEIIERLSGDSIPAADEPKGDL